MRLLGTQALLLVAVACWASCGDPSSPDSIAGNYIANTFTLSGDLVADVLDEGGHLTITLNADNTMSGNLFVPASASGGDKMDASMAGTHSVVGDTVTFNQDADTFVRDLSWIFDGSELSATESFSGVTVTVVLGRQ